MNKGIACSDIFKSYGDLAVLRGIDLKIESGEIVAIVGPFWCGKNNPFTNIGHP
jgi:ABC-type polar amino acid transport system ATPase subunit